MKSCHIFMDIFYSNPASQRLAQIRYICGMNYHKKQEISSPDFLMEVWSW